MNRGLAIFKKHRRFQRGTENLEPGPLPPEKRLIGPKERAGLYDPGHRASDDEEYNKAYEEHERLLDQLDHTESDRPEHRMGPEDVYKTVGIEINGKEMEVPAVFDNMTDQDRAIIQALPHSQWPRYILEKIENNARDELEQGHDVYGNRPEGDEDLPPPQQHARGTSKVQHLQGGLGEIPAWDEPPSLPPPPSDPNVFTNQYPPGWVNSPSGNGSTPQGSGMQIINGLGWDPSKPTYGFGSGEPTRRGIDIGVSGAANVFLPGFGWVAGKLARGLWHVIQNMQMNGASRHEIKQAVQQAQQNQGGGGGGFHFEMPEGGYYKPDYLRSIGYGPGQGKGSLWPGSTGNWGYNQDNPDSPFYDPTGPAAGGFSGGVSGGGGSFFHQTPGSRATSIAGAFTGLGAGGGGYLGSNYTGGGAWSGRSPLSQSSFANSMKFIPGYTNNLSYPDYQALWNQIHTNGPMAQKPPEPGAMNTQGAFHSGQQIRSRQQGDSDVNPGLKIFHRKLLKKPKPKEQLK